MTSRSLDEAALPRPARPARVLDALPAAFLAVVAAAAAIGVVCASVGLRPLAEVGPSRIVLAVLVLVGVSSLVLGARVSEVAPGATALPALPALVLTAYAVAARVISPGARAEWFLGGDHVRHLVYVADERLVGNLDYGQESYPRAWHTVVATLWSATGAEGDGAGLRSLVDLMSTAVWLLPAVLSLATGSLTVALAHRCGLGGRPAAVAGLGAAAAVLLPPFLADYQALGFENSYLGAIVLAVVAREVVAARATGARVGPAVVAVVAVVVCAHSWQLLLPAAGVALLCLGLPVLALGGARERVVIAGAAVVGAVVALPALRALFTDIGIEHATDSGVRAPVPVVLLVLGIAAAAAVTVGGRGDAALRSWVAIVLLPGLTAVGVAALVGIPLSDYYPSKLLWHSAVLGLSPLAVVLVGAWVALGRSRTPVVGRVLRGAGAAVALPALVFALASPTGAFVGAWSSARGPLVLDAVSSPGADGARVVWLGDVGSDTIARILLDFYRVGSGERAPQAPLDVAGECGLLRASARPEVLSDRSTQQVSARYACSPGVVLVRVQRDASG